MNNNFLNAALLVALFMLVISCSKTKGSGGNDGDDHHVDENDTSFPVIRIDNPLASQV